MPRLLASYPLFWILTMGTSSDAGPCELLFGLLQSDGAARITLGPLDHEAQAALIGDVLGAVPDQTLIELAADAAGNPLVLAEAFRGPRDENAIVVRDGHASLAPAQVSSAQVTSRIETLARDRLKGLSARARRPAVHQHAHGRVPSAPGVLQARHQVARRPGPDRAGARPARDDANPMTEGCEAARVAARLTSC